MILSPTDTLKFNQDGRIVTVLLYGYSGYSQEDYKETVGALALGGVGAKKTIIDVAPIEGGGFQVSYVSWDDATIEESSKSSGYAGDYGLGLVWNKTGQVAVETVSSIGTDFFKELKALIPIVAGFLILLILAK